MSNVPFHPKQGSSSNEVDAEKTVEESADYLAEIVGEESRAGERLQAGPILKLMVETAAAVAYSHAKRRPVLLSMDRLDFTRIICHLDLVKMEGRLIEAGRSSMVVEIKCFRKRSTERSYTPTHVGYFVMVALDEQHQSARNIPRLSYNSPMGAEVQSLAAHRRAQLAERRQALEWIDAEPVLRVEDVLERNGLNPYHLMTPEDTEVRLKGQLIAVGSWSDRRVRAGELLVWLDRVAVYTGRQFTGNHQMVAISLNDVLFKNALQATDRIEAIARVVYVRAHTLEIAIELTIYQLEGRHYTLDPINFFLLNYDESGEKKKVATGLKFMPDDQMSLKRYLLSKTRYAFWKSNPESHLLQSPD